MNLEYNFFFLAASSFTCRDDSTFAFFPLWRIQLIRPTTILMLQGCYFDFWNFYNYPLTLSCHAAGIFRRMIGEADTMVVSDSAPAKEKLNKEAKSSVVVCLSRGWTPHKNLQGFGLFRLNFSRKYKPDTSFLSCYRTCYFLMTVGNVCFVLSTTIEGDYPYCHTTLMTTTMIIKIITIECWCLQPILWWYLSVAQNSGARWPNRPSGLVQALQHRTF